MHRQDGIKERKDENYVIVFYLKKKKKTKKTII